MGAMPDRSSSAGAIAGVSVTTGPGGILAIAGVIRAIVSDCPRWLSNAAALPLRQTCDEFAATPCPSIGLVLDDETQEFVSCVGQLFFFSLSNRLRWLLLR